VEDALDASAADQMSYGAAGSQQGIVCVSV
jgi:hypothetical protein